MAGANYPLTINRDEEEIVRNAAKQVDLRLNAYLQYYLEREVPRERIIAMVAYQFALELLQERQRNDTEPFVTKIKELTELLDEHFSEQKSQP